MLFSLKNQILAAALTVGIGGALATKASHRQKDGTILPLYYWTQPVGPPALADPALAKLMFGCFGGLNTCATGTLILGVGETPLVLYKE